MNPLSLRIKMDVYTFCALGPLVPGGFFSHNSDP